MQRNLQQVCEASLMSVWLCIFQITLQHLISLEPRNEEFTYRFRVYVFSPIFFDRIPVSVKKRWENSSV